MRDFISEVNLSFGINFHSWGNLYIIPYGYSQEATIDKYDLRFYEDFHNNAGLPKSAEFGTPAEVIYSVNGLAIDYFYSLGILGVSIELGDYHGFFEPVAQIRKIIEEAWGPVSYLYRLSGPWVDITTSDLHETAAVDADYYSNLALTWELTNAGLQPQGSGKFNISCRHSSGSLRALKVKSNGYKIGDTPGDHYRTQVADIT